MHTWSEVDQIWRCTENRSMHSPYLNALATEHISSALQFASSPPLNPGNLIWAWEYKVFEERLWTPEEQRLELGTQINVLLLYVDVGSLVGLSQEIVQFRLSSRFPTLSIKQPICVLIIKQTVKVFSLQTRLDICKTHST